MRLRRKILMLEEYKERKLAKLSIKTIRGWPTKKGRHPTLKLNPQAHF